MWFQILLQAGEMPTIPEIPEPWPIPPPTADIDFSPLWDINNWIDAVRSFRTVFVLLQQFHIITILILLFLLSMALGMLLMIRSTRLADEAGADDEDDE